MPEHTSHPTIEDKLRAATRMPAPRPEFVAGLRMRLVAQAPQPPTLFDSFRSACQVFWRRPVFATALVAALILIASLGVIGPQKVFAAVGRLFGYIPGVGVIDQSEPLRVLAAPVSQTRDGVTLSVTAATLTADRTHINFRFFGVPGAAYPDREDVIGCHQMEYLRLPDGTKLERRDDFPPVPAGVSEAVFVAPCILDTLPGKAPENWELPLRFAPAPPDLAVMPVTQLPPSPELTGTAPVASQQAGANPVSAATTAPVEQAIKVDQVIETTDGYILTIQLQSQLVAQGHVQMTGPVQVRDASGKLVRYSYPHDVQPPADSNIPGLGSALQFRAAGLAYPLTISISGVEIQPADPQATAEFTFDAGPNPQPGQEWTPNQEIQFAGHTLKLVRVMADSRNGFSFEFKSDPQVVSASLQIDGYVPRGWGGGSGGLDGKFSTSLSFAQIPAGSLKVRLSNLMVTGQAHTWQGQWTPATIRTDLPANPTPQPGLCLAADSLDQLQPLPENLSDGAALVYEALGDTGKWGLVRYNLDGSHLQVLAADAGWGVLSPDGRQLVYTPFSTSEVDMRVKDLASQAERALTGASGFGQSWSPDGRQIAYLGGEKDQVFVVDAAGGQPHRVSDQSYSAIVGWSPDSARLYTAIPFTDRSAWQVRGIDLVTGEYQDLFTIENGSPKNLGAVLSPDGDWIAYTGGDQGAVYLVHPDGSDPHLVLDSPAASLVWSRSGWLGINLVDLQTPQYRVLILKPETCEIYRLAGLSGELRDLSMP